MCSTQSAIVYLLEGMIPNGSSRGDYDFEVGALGKKDFKKIDKQVQLVHYQHVNVVERYQHRLAPDQTSNVVDHFPIRLLFTLNQQLSLNASEQSTGNSVQIVDADRLNVNNPVFNRQSFVHIKQTFFQNTALPNP